MSLYSSRTYDEIIYRLELDQRTAGDTDFVVAYTLTRSQPAQWQGYSRRIDREMLQEVGWMPAERPLVFICGPTAFVELAATTCVDLGYDSTRIKTERFGPSGGAT